MTGNDSWIRNFIGGQFLAPTGDRGLENRDPATGSVLARVDVAGADLVDRAVESATKAVAGWSGTPPGERAELLRRAARRIEERFDEFVAAEVADTGKPIRLARELDVPRAIANFRAFADIVCATGEDAFFTDLPGGRRALNYTVRKPLGVVAVIVPWNLPLLLLTWKVAPALGCGNAVVVKPSELTPSTAVLLAEVLGEIGLPAGVYNVVHGAGSTGDLLTGHPGIDGVTFTGSSATGTKVMANVAPRVRPVSFELGGKNAAIVFDDVDLEEAVAGLSRSVFTNTGQVCLCTERVYVHRRIFADVVAGLVDSARALRLGNPADEATTTGPLISRAHRQKVLRYFALAEESGAKTIVGGGIPMLGTDLDGGAWIEPTLWTGLSNSDRAVREEVFGPVAAVIPFDSEEEVIALANDSDYGLAAAVWTDDLRRGHRVAQAMNVGMAWLNTWFLRDLRSPFGGMGLSGIGREGGASSLHFYTEPTNVCVLL